MTLSGNKQDSLRLLDLPKLSDGENPNRALLQLTTTYNQVLHLQSYRGEKVERQVL